MSLSSEVSSALAQVAAAAEAGNITPSAAGHIKTWLTEPPYAEYLPIVTAMISQADWKTLDDVFWTIIPFGTGGRRGRMHPVGCNAINDRTIGESIQGLVDYVNGLLPAGQSRSCAVAYDTRHRSRDFAELSAEILVAGGFKVWFLDGYRSTPELSFAVRFKKCDCGVMITASHNPPSDNAVKVYWSTGGQLLPPHDKGVINKVMQVKSIARENFQSALKVGKIEYCQQDVDAAFIAQVKAQSQAGPRLVKIIYSPLHGVGGSAVLPALEADGFTDVETFAPQANPDGDFPNVPDHVANPENAAVFDALIERGQTVGADLALATDPDCDRLGAASPVGKNPAGPWKTFTGNQIGALLTEFILERRKGARSLTPQHYVAKTLVTSEMIRRIADHYGVTTHGNLLVGFKWIGGLIDEAGPDLFVLGTEESHGYQVGTYTRDKDGAVAAMLLAELAAACKAVGMSLHEKLDSLFWQYGCHAENTVSVTLPGSHGMAKMKALMTRFREQPPKTLAGIPVKQVRDYENQVIIRRGEKHPLPGPKGDLVILDLDAEGNYAAVRPSGTEPKIKFYLFAYEPAEQIAHLETTKSELSQRLHDMHADLKKAAEE